MVRRLVLAAFALLALAGGAVAEGFTEDGTPLRREIFFEVE